MRIRHIAASRGLRMLGAINSISVERGFGFATEIDEFRSGGLHAKRQFIAGNAAVDFGVLQLFKTRGVEGFKRIEWDPIFANNNPQTY